MAMAPAWKGPKPTVAMKQFQWSTLPRMAVLKTHFKDFKADEIDLDVKALESLFSKEEAKPKEDKPEDAKAKKEVAHSVLDPKRLQNTSIFVRTLKIENNALKEAILTLDEDVLTPERTLKLCDNLPEPDELAAINAWLAEKPENTLEKMNEADQFFKALGEIPQLRERLECYAFKQSFPAKVAEMKPSFLRVKQAVTCMKNNCDNFKKVCEVVLAIGNFLNSGTRNGNTSGFSLRTLSKLAEHKASAAGKNLNLLRYLINFIETKFPEAMNWTTDLAPVKYATKVEFEGVLTDLSELKRGLTQMQNRVPTVQKSESKWDVFDRLMPEAVEALSKEFVEIDTLATSVKEEFGDLVEMWGEKKASSKPEEFFGIINGFLVLWDNEIKAIKLEQIDAEKEAKKKELEEKKAAKLAELEAKRKLKEKREALEAKKAAAKGGAAAKPAAAGGAAPAAGGDADAAGGGDDDGDDEPEPKPGDPASTLDSALGSMKSGRAFERRRLRRQDTLRQKREQEAKLKADREAAGQ